MTNTQKKQRKKDSKGEERKIRSSPYVTPMQYERDIDKSAHLQFYCIQEPKINFNVPTLGMEFGQMFSLRRPTYATVMGLQES